MKRLLTVLFCFLLAIPAYADIAYEPPASSFYEAHRDACTPVERNFYSNGQAGYITLRRAPDGLKTGYITNGVPLRIYCTYGDWAMITHENGEELSTPVWTEQSGLYLIYDSVSFMEEYQAEIRNVGGKMLLPEGAEEFYFYEYPGAANPGQYSYFDESVIDASSRTYTDPEGREWGYITYYRGLRNKWVCLDAPLTVIPPFGGDPNLALIEAQTAPDQDSVQEELPLDEPDTLIVEAESPIVPAKEPPSIVRNDLPVLAVVLVAVAVAAAVVLILVCYRKKKKEE